MLGLVLAGLAGALLAVTVGYSAAIAGTANMLGGGSAAVPQCLVTSSQASLSGTRITSMTATVQCNQGGTYTVQATVTSGASSTQTQATVALTASTPTEVVLDVSPRVDTSGNTSYDVTYRMTQ